MSEETLDPVTWFNENFEQFVEPLSLEREGMKEYRDLLERFGKLLGGNGKILDAGCGWGRDVNYFVQNGFDAHGIDKAPRPLSYGIDNYPVQDMENRLHRMDVADLGFKDQTFDGVWCNSVIHFYPPEKMSEPVSELSRVLKENGVLYISFKLSEDKPRSSIRTEKDGSKVKRYLMPPEKIQELLKKHDMDIIREQSEIEREKFEHPVWNIFCRKRL